MRASHEICAMINDMRTATEEKQQQQMKQLQQLQHILEVFATPTAFRVQFALL